MKLTKAKLRQIIKEELAQGRTSSSEYRASASVKDRLKAATASGVTGDERNVLLNLQKKLAAAAKLDNIATGRILQMATKLEALLDAVIEKRQKK